MNSKISRLRERKLNIFFLKIGCYFGNDYVNLVEGGRRQIKYLKVGDRVRTLSSNGQHIIEDEVFYIPHVAQTTSSMYHFKLIFKKNNIQYS